MKTLSIVIPVYNEGKRIKKTLKTLEKGFKFNGLKLEKIVFVNDGSNDGTIKLVKDFIEQNKKNLLSTSYNLQLITYHQNRGRGYAIKRGALNCFSDYVLYVDADLSIPITNLAKFIPLMKKGYDLLFASKKMPGAKQTIKRGLIRTIIGYGHSIVASLFLGVFVWDFQGGFKIFSKAFIEEVFPLLTVSRWGLDMEVIFLGKKLGYKTAELPASWGHIENGSKVKLVRDILRSLREMKQIRQNWFKGEYTFLAMVNLQYA